MSGDLPDILIWVVAKTLSDGSVAHDVELPGGEKIPAVTESDAEEMAQKIADAINDHSVVTADVMVA